MGCTPEWIMWATATSDELIALLIVAMIVFHLKFVWRMKNLERELAKILEIEEEPSDGT